MSRVSSLTNVAIEVEGVSKRYRITEAKERGYKTLRDSAAALFSRRAWKRERKEDVWALRDVSFEVNEGEAFGIIGANGAGKSTLLKILSRITEPTSGRARIRGRVASLLEVGTGFHPELTGRENVFLNGAILGMPRSEIRQKFDEIVAFAEVEKFIDTPVKRYSSGMYVRLAFAVAAHLDPEILLVDEVLAVGDVGFQRKCLEKMGEESREGRTVLFVSHNMSAIRGLCSRGMWMKGGEVVERGQAGEVIDKYLRGIGGPGDHLGVKEFIASLPPDPVLRLEDIALTQGRRAHTDFVTGEPIELSIAFEVLQDCDGLHVYFRLYDEEGVLLVESMNNGSDPRFPRMAAGHYVSRAVVPADLLAQRRYRLEINAGVAYVRHIFPSPLAFTIDVRDSGRLTRCVPGYVYPGRLAPRIEWNTEVARSLCVTPDSAKQGEIGGLDGH